MASVGLVHATVGHARLWPKKNSFSYKVFYVHVPITKNNRLTTPRLFSFNKWNIFSVFSKDYLSNDAKKSLYELVAKELKTSGFFLKDEYEITLITLPRIFGFAFNPITYWLITDRSENLIAVLCEVHNTFKQTHNYLLTKPGLSAITIDDILTAKKELYVSPYTKIEGKYEFTFTYKDGRFTSVINYFDKSGRQVLNTYTGGNLESVNSKKLLLALLRYPFMTVLVVARIHWQALRLLIKKVTLTLRTRPKDYKNNQTTK
jgi:DUF1365 family protein